jgi:hypothetical protein
MLLQRKHSFGSTLNLLAETEIRNVCYVTNTDNQTRQQSSPDWNLNVTDAIYCNVYTI